MMPFIRTASILSTESEEFRHDGKILFIQSIVENGWYIVQNGGKWHC